MFENPLGCTRDLFDNGEKPVGLNNELKVLPKKGADIFFIRKMYPVPLIGCLDDSYVMVQTTRQQIPVPV
jgi:hypothetical protein